MRQKSGPVREPATQVLKNIRRATRRHFSAEDKIRIVLEGLRGEESIAELCRRTFYRWYNLYHTGGPEALGDRSPRPDRGWNRIPDDIRERIEQRALGEPALSPRE